MTYEHERDFQKDCIKYLEGLQEIGYPLELLHLNVANTYGKQRARQSKHRRDQPDLFIFFPSGKTIMVELKREKGRLSQWQEEKLEKYKCMGFDVYVIKGDLPLFQKIIKKYLWEE